MIAFKTRSKTLLCLLMSFLLISSLTSSLTVKAANIPFIDQIRVALYLNQPNKFTNIIKAVTLSSKSAMQLSVDSGKGNTQWLTFSDNDQLRLTNNDFKIKVLETTTFSDAQLARDTIKSASGHPIIISLNKNGKVTYQVVEGSYATLNDASSALTKWKGNAALAKISGASFTLTGSYAFISGSYTTKIDALKAATNFGAQGLDTAIALSLDDQGKLQYSVLIGMVSTEAELDLVKIAANKVTTDLKRVSAADSLLVNRNDHTVTDHATSSDDLFMYGTHMKVTVKGANNGVIKVLERSERSYRGLIEVGLHSNEMYVVNELPIDEYLYSVVAIEMYTSWPKEALKAQAVTARTYAIYKGLSDSFAVSHVVDTTLSQAYYGVGSEAVSSTAAVNETKGEVLLYNGKLVETLYHSNAGGKTADAKEIWGNEVAYLKSVSSPDQIAEQGMHNWYRVVMPDGKVGYIREDLVDQTSSKNEIGKAIVTTNTDGTNIRKNPVIQNSVPTVAQVNKGVQLVVLDRVVQNNAMTWRLGPYTSDELIKSINTRAKVSGSIQSLEITKTGQSGRVTEVSVNGTALNVGSPINLRSTLGVEGSLPSTLFTIESTGKLTMLAANNQTKTKTDGAGGIHVLSANNLTTTVQSDYLYVLDGKGNVRVATKDSAYQFNGTGNGHGAGMSQYGAYSLAKQGYDYKYILEYYYSGTTIAKDE